MTSCCCSCHHAARTGPRWPPGPSNEAYLSSPHLEASPATTFRACSSPAPTPVKPQPAPAILSQESVLTTLSITHHTRKRPSTGPRTTHGPQVATFPTGRLPWLGTAAPCREVVVAWRRRSRQEARCAPGPAAPASSSPLLRPPSPSPLRAASPPARCLPAGPPPPSPADLLRHGSWEGARWESREVSGERRTRVRDGVESWKHAFDQWGETVRTRNTR
jgi:hypothetical protein